MAANFTVLNGNTRVTMAWIGGTTKLQNLIKAAAKHLQWAGLGNQVDPPLTTRAGVDAYINGLTNQQRLNLVYSRLDEVVKTWASDWHTNYAQESARDTAATEMFTLFEFNEE